MRPHNKLKNLDVVWLLVFEEEELQGCVGIIVLRGGGLREPTDPTICSTLQDCFLGALECFLCFGKFIFPAAPPRVISNVLTFLSIECCKVSITKLLDTPNGFSWTVDILRIAVNAWQTLFVSRLNIF